MSRGGWLQFSVIAKNADLSEAIHLCRHWDEVYELAIISLYDYFPAAGWKTFAGDQWN